MKSSSPNTSTMKPSESFFAAFDVGTSKIRLVIVDKHGNELWSAERPLDVLTPGPGVALQSSLQILSLFEELMVEAQDALPVEAIRGLCITATAPTIMVLGPNYHPITGWLWSDRRRLGPAGPAQTGLQKLAAMAADERVNPDAITHVFNMGSYLAYCFTGECTSSAAVLASKFRWSLGWNFDLQGFEAYGLDPWLDRMPKRVVATGETIGMLRTDWAQRLGLVEPVEVVDGGFDSVAAFTGCGIFGPSDSMFLTLGTSASLAIAPVNQKRLPTHTWPVMQHLIPDVSLLMGGFEGGLGMLSSCAQQARAELGCSPEALEDALDKINGSSPPWWAFPFGDAPLRAPLAGVALPQLGLVPPCRTYLEWLRSLQTGVAYFLRYSIEDLRRYHTVPIRSIRIAGGGAASASLCQRIADVCQMPVKAFGRSAAGRGAAVLAATTRLPVDVRRSVIADAQPVREFMPQGASSRADEQGFCQFVAYLTTAARMAA
jgi:sugar (pentulose or hexulose) kinase